MRSLPEELLHEHGCRLKHRELPWQQVLRLNQSLWREEQGYEPLSLPNGEYLGSVLCTEGAEALGHNLMSAASLRVARREASAGRNREKVVDADRLFTNLLTSQALCFSLFADLQEDFNLATRVISAMLGDLVTVERVELEYSPGRGDPTYTGDHSAADAYVEYRRGQVRGFLCIEVKYHEDLKQPANWRDPYRPRYSEVAKAMACFIAGADDVLRKPPLEQLWRDHLLAGAILHHPKDGFDEGAFVILAPKINEAWEDAATQYRKHLSNEETFRVWTLEAFVDALASHADAAWSAKLRSRYCDFSRVDQAYQDFYLQQVTAWATTIRKDLGTLQTREGHRVQFRPSSSGVTMVGLLPDKPQLGKSYGSIAALRADFVGEFAKHCDGSAPERLTPEKELQSFLVANALSNGRRMVVLNEASANTDAPVELVFLMDELVIPSIQGDQRLDILALRKVGDSTASVLIELKSERAKTELLRQTSSYATFVNRHRDRVEELASAILGVEVRFDLPVEKWIVWPSARQETDPQEASLRNDRVRVVEYEHRDGRFAFRVGQGASH